LSYATKSEQVDLLQKVLAATDADAEEEQVTGVDWSTKKHKVRKLLAALNYLLFMPCHPTVSADLGGPRGHAPKMS